MVREDDKKDIGTPDATTPMTTMATTSGRAARMHGGETPMTPFPISRYHPFDRTQQVIMTYRGTGQFSLASGTGATAVDVIQFRLNSIYDCRNAPVTYTANPTAVADTIDGVVLNTPAMRDFWMTFYRYWSVVNSNYKFKVRSSYTGAAYTTGQQEYFIYEHGLQNPPLVDTAATPQLIKKQWRKFHPNLVHIMRTTDEPQVTGTSYTQRNALNWQVYHGSYKPGSIKHDVVEDELHQTWHKPTEVPPTKEVVTVIAQRHADSNTTATTTMDWTMEINYVVQLKDLVAEIEYIQPASDLFGITNWASQTN